MEEWCNKGSDHPAECCIHLSLAMIAARLHMSVEPVKARSTTFCDVMTRNIVTFEKESYHASLF